MEAQIKYRQKIAHNVEGRGERSELEGQRVRKHIFSACSRHTARYWPELSSIALTPSDLTFLRCSQQIPPPDAGWGKDPLAVRDFMMCVLFVKPWKPTEYCEH